MEQIKISQLIKAIVYGTISFIVIIIVAFILLNAGAMIFQHKTLIDLFLIWNSARLQFDSGLLSTNTISLIFSIFLSIGWGFQVWMFLPKEDSL